jgi:pimeloyl-ACP methyl ester carboxylesterase
MLCLLLPAIVLVGGEVKGQPTAVPAATNSKAVVKIANTPTRFLERNGRKLAYRVIGKGDTMLLCQRFRGTLDDWDPAFLEYLGRNYTVIIFNYSGMGSSTGQPGAGVMGFARDVLDLADGLSVPKFIMAGWSIGGMVAQTVAMQFPDRVKALVLIGTKPPGKISHGPEEIFLKTAYLERNTLEHEVILFFEPVSAESTRLASESHDRISIRKENRDPLVTPSQFVYYSKVFEDFSQDQYGTRKKLMETNIPVLVISGDHEVCFPPENWFELNRQLPTTQVIVIPRSGHGPQHQYPELIAAYIHNFLKSAKA